MALQLVSGPLRMSATPPDRWSGVACAHSGVTSRSRGSFNGIARLVAATCHSLARLVFVQVRDPWSLNAVRIPGSAREAWPPSTTVSSAPTHRVLPCVSSEQPSPRGGAWYDEGTGRGSWRSLPVRDVSMCRATSTVGGATRPWRRSPRAAADVFSGRPRMHLDQEVPGAMRRVAEWRACR